jgi:hypothetical protein
LRKFLEQRERALARLDKEIERIENLGPGGWFGMSVEEKYRRVRELDRERQRLLSCL